MTDFLRRGWNTYFGNAAAIRDFRAQLRGNKAIFIWGAYLGLLIALCGLAYASIVSQQSQSIAQLQQQLNQFYLTVMAMLGAVISLAAPALTASAITIERQRRSLDLVFSAPVSPRYLLVGKLIAGFRYLVMLLVLALPVTSVCVVMGGATWSDVIGAFLVLLSSGILLMAIGLVISSLTPTSIGAVAGAYLATIAYLIVTSIFSAILTAMTLSGYGSGSNEAMWTVALSPFTAAVAAPTFTRVGTWEVPNWVFGLLFALSLSRLMLAGAGSALSTYRSPETKTLRIQGWIVAFLLSFLAGVPLGGASLAMLRSIASGGSPSGGPTPDYLTGLTISIGAIGILFLIPHLVCFAVDAERKYRPDGLLSLKTVLIGSPSGAYPYLVGVVALAVAGVSLGYRYAANAWPGLEFAGMALWALGFLTLWWGLGRFVSSFKLGLKGARAALMGLMIVLLAIPVPILLMFSAATYASGTEMPIWRAYLLYPLIPEKSDVAWMYGAIMGCIGFLFAFLGESNLRASESR